MTRRNIDASILASAAVVGGSAFGAEEAKMIALPTPRSSGDKPLIEALALRRSTREFAPDRCRHRFCRTFYRPHSVSIVLVAIAQPPMGLYQDASSVTSKQDELSRQELLIVGEIQGKRSTKNCPSTLIV